MADEGATDLQLQGDLDNQLVLKALDEMEKAADDMAKSGDKSFQEIAASVKKAATELRKNQKQLEEGSKTYQNMFKKGEISIDEFRAKLTKLVADIKRVAKEADDATEGFDLSGMFRGVEKVDLEEIVATGKLLARVQELQTVLDQMATSASANAREMGSALQANLDTILKDTTSSTIELDKEVKVLIRDAKELSKTFGEETTTDFAERMKLTTAETKLNKIRDAASKLFDGTGQAFDKFGQEIQKEADAITDMFNRGQISAKEFDQKINELGKNFKATLATFSEGEFKPIDEMLQFDEAIAKQQELFSLIEHWDEANSVLGKLQANQDLFFQKTHRAFELYKDGVITVDELNKRIAESVVQAKRLQKAFGEGIDPQGIAEGLRTAIDANILADLTEEARKMVTSVNSGMKDWGGDFIVRAVEIARLFEQGQISAKEYGAAIADLGKSMDKILTLTSEADLQPLEDRLQLTQATVRLEEITDLISQMFLAQPAQLRSTSKILEEMVSKINDQYDAGLIGAEELNSKLKNLVVTAKQFVSTLGETPETLAAENLTAGITGKQIDIIKERVVDLAQSGRESLKDLGDEIDTQADLLVSMFNRGQISVEQYAAAVTDLGKKMDTALKLSSEAGLEPMEDSLQLAEAAAGVAKLEENITKMAASTESELVNAAVELVDKMNELHGQFSEGVITASELNSKLKETVTTSNRLISTFGETTKTDMAESLKLNIVNKQLEAINYTVSGLVVNADSSLNTLGNTIQQQSAALRSMFDRGQISVEEYAAAVSLLGTEMNKNLKLISTEELQSLDEGLQLTEAIGKISQLEEHIIRMGASTSSELVNAAADLNDELGIIDDQFAAGVITAEELNSKLGENVSMAERLQDQFKETEEIDMVEALQLIEAEAAMKNVLQAGEQLARSTNVEAQKAGKALIDNAKVMQDQYDRGVKSIGQFNKEVTTLEKKTVSLSKKFKGIVAADFSKEMKIDLTIARIVKLEGVIKRLTESSSSAAQTAGQNIEDAANKLIQMLQNGEIEAEDLNKELKKLESQGKELGNTYGVEMKDGIERATVSVWKMGNAMDRIGVRGAGGILRIFDAVKSLNPALIAVTIALAGVAIGLKKIIEISVELGKKLGKAFVGLIKDSVALAEQYETVELQLRNIFKGKVGLARETMKRIVELGAQLGVDLTGRISQTFLPLVKSFDEFERIGEIAATFAVKTGKTVDEVSRALQQGVAGQFQSMQRQFFVTGTHIERIKELQEELGDTSGLIEGLEEYFEASGTGWNTYEDTLRRVKGQLKETFNLFRLELGEPVKIALVDALTDLKDWIADNKETIKNFFSDIGKAIGRVIETVGDFVQNILNDIDAEELDEIATKFDELIDNIGLLIDDLGDADFDLVLDTLMLMLDITNNLVANARLFLSLMKAGGHVVGVDTVDDVKDMGKALVLGGPKAMTGRFIGGYLGNIKKEITGEESGFDLAKEELITTLEQQAALDGLTARREKLREARRKAGEEGKKYDDEEADAGFELNAMLTERADLVEDVQDAAKEMNDAFAEFNKEMERAWRDIFIEEGRRGLDMRIENAQKRLDMATQHRIALEDIQTKTDLSEEDRLIDKGRDEEDIVREHDRKMLEVDIEEAKKIEDIEEKHQNRLKEIREKFDLDAEEAIRMNDAVALLRIRRRMELELRQEERKHEDSKEKAVEAAEDKRDKLKQQLQYEYDDLEIANKRKLEDIETTNKREVDAEKKKYADSLAQQEVEEQRKRDELQKWLDQEVEDFDRMWHDKNEDLIDQMDEAISIYENGVMRILEINARIAQLMVAGFVNASQIPQMGMIPGINQDFWGAETGGFGDRLDEPGGSTNSTINQLRSLAHSLAFQLGRDQITHDMIDNATYDELMQMISDFQNQTYGQGRQHGGITNPGVPYTVGEEGPETFIPMQHGIIAPHDAFMMSPASQQTSNISTDNSRNIQADISLLDPTQLSEIQKTLIRSIITEELLRMSM